MTSPGVARRVRRTWQRVRTVPGLGRDVGALSVVIIAGLVAAVVIVTNQIGGVPWNTNQVTVQAEFANAVAVNPTKSQQVRIAGVPVGTITGSQATDHGTSIVSMAVDRGDVIYSNARATLRPVNPLNEMYIDLQPGGSPGHPLASNEVIPLAQTSTPTQLDDILSHLDTRAQNALTDLLSQSTVALAGAPQQLPAGLRATDGTLQSLQPVVTALQTRREKVQQLVTSLSEIATAVGGNDTRLAQLVNSTQQTLGVLANQSTPLRQSLNELPQFAADLRSAMSKTADLTGQLNPLLDNLSQASSSLPSTLNALAGFSDQLQQTMTKAGPVVAKAGPVVAELRPVVSDLQGSLADLRPVTAQLDPATGTLVRYLNPLAAFVYNTAALTAENDTNGTMVRGQVTLDVLDPLGVGHGGCAPLPSYLPCLPGGLR